MPIYEYECLKCSKRFELRRRMSDSDHDVKCPSCGTENPRRVISVFATNSSGYCTPGSPT